MESFEIAHLNLPGTNGDRVNVIVVFLNEQFDHKPEPDKHKIHSALQICASQAGLAGNVVPVWMDSLGHTKFIAPPQQHAFFRSASYDGLAAQINRTLSCAG